MYGLWDEDALSLGKPSCMDTPTLIEWLQQQLETKEETHLRHAVLVEEHKNSHRPGIISACCINAGSFSHTLVTPIVEMR